MSNRNRILAKEAILEFFRRRRIKQLANRATAKLTQGDIDRIEKRDSAYSNSVKVTRTAKG